MKTLRLIFLLTSLPLLMAASYPIPIPGTTGNVMRSNGSKWTSNAAALLASTATTATNMTTVAVSNSASYYPIFSVSSANGDHPYNLGTGLTFNPSTNVLTTTTFSGALTGTASGNTTYTANQYGVVLSGSANSMVVLAPDASTTKVLTSGGAAANPTWATVASAPTSSYELSNLGLATSVGASALTISLKQSDGSTDPAAGSGAVKVGMRSSTLTSGLYNQRSATAATSLVISSGSTLGQVSATPSTIWIYLIDNAGTLELAAGGVELTEFGVVTTTAEGGAGAADSNAILYSTSARSNVPFRLIGKLLNTQATAGTWASAGTTLGIGIGGDIARGGTIAARYTSTAGQAFTDSAVVVDFATKSFDTNAAVTTGASWKFTAPISGVYLVSVVMQTGTFTGVASNYIVADLYKNGSLYGRIDIEGTETTVASQIRALNGTQVAYLVAGDYIDCRILKDAALTVSLGTTAANVNISIERVGN